MSVTLDDLFREGPALYTVPSGAAFLPALARVLKDTYTDDPFAMSEVTVYLPSRRSVREAAEAFLGEGGEGAVLPRLRAIGDVDEDDLVLTQSGAAASAGAGLPPAVSALERRLVLASFVRRARQAQSDVLPRWPAALRAADELGVLLDEFHASGVPFEKLGTLVGDGDVPQGAAHWQHSVEFLKVVTEAWPAWLSEPPRMDGAARKRALMEAIEPGEGSGPIIAAGSLGSIPATAAFLAKVAGAPRGLVVLPGLDADMPPAVWEEIEPPHPQALFKILLRDWFGGASHGDVPAWPAAPGDASGARRRFLSFLMRPAEATGDWHEQLAAMRADGAVGPGTRGLHLATGRTEDEEAGFVALLLREVLETPGKTAMLVTPDRVLARRVQSRLALWGVRVDDSGGVPVDGTYRGGFLRCVARWLADPADPVAIGAVIGHDLCRAGEAPAVHAARARALDRCLRGGRPAADMAGLLDRLGSDGLRVAGCRDETKPRARALGERLTEIAAPFAEAEDMGARLEALIAAAEALAATDTEDGAARLWRYEDGEALAAHLTALLEAGPVLPAAGLEEGPGWFAETVDALLSGPVIRPRGGHPRLRILGLLESRLLSADRVVVAGLNEGVWPTEPRTDPFLSRPMRAALGLPSLDEVVGRAAHDFGQLAAQPEVWFTRSARRGGSPADPARWLVRLQSVCETEDAVEVEDATERLRAQLHALTRCEAPARPEAAPAPKPEAALRPVSLSISDVDKLLRDPYSIYAKRVLALPALDRLDRPVDAAMRGTFYHALFEAYAKRYAEARPPDPIRALRDMAEEVFEAAQVPLDLRAFWRPRMKVALEAFARFDAAVMARDAVDHLECDGTWDFEVEGRPFRIKGRADRIALTPGGEALIFDYKTGTVPTMNQVKAEFSAQLLVTAQMVREGAFGLPPATPVLAAYVDSLPSRLPQETFPKEHTLKDDELAVAVDEGIAKLKARLTDYARPDTPYLSQPRAFFTTRFGDYDHLARRGEWAGLGEGDEA